MCYGKEVARRVPSGSHLSLASNHIDQTEWAGSNVRLLTSGLHGSNVVGLATKFLEITGLHERAFSPAFDDTLGGNQDQYTDYEDPTAACAARFQEEQHTS